MFPGDHRGSADLSSQIQTKGLNGAIVFCLLMVFCLSVYNYM